MAVFRAREAFAYTDKQGVPRVIRPGDLVSSDDPNFKGKEHLFETVEVAAARAAGVETATVETTTAEPGERRSLSTPSRKARRGKADDEAGQETTPTDSKTDTGAPDKGE